MDNETMHAYFDCFSGISGDMTLAAFLDLGVPVEWLKKSLEQMPLSGFELSVNSGVKNGIQAKKLDIAITTHQHPWHYADIKRQIHEGALSDRTKTLALNIFDRLAEVESQIHGCDKDTVHFHEVGALDSIIDIIGTALCIDYLEIQSISASRIPLGSGLVNAQHGVLPVPAPATIALLKNVPVYGTPVPFELVTPTGAAIIAVLAERFGAMPTMQIKKIGYGAGTRDLNDRPNCLRILYGKLADGEKSVQQDRVMVIETAIDDLNPEIAGYVMERLFEEGAIDVFWTPVQMKKNRPGFSLTVLCAVEDQHTLINRIFKDTTTLGVRMREDRRCTLFREIVSLPTRYGEIPVKRIQNPDGTFRLAPEYEICKKIALEQNRPIGEVYTTIHEAGLEF